MICKTEAVRQPIGGVDFALEQRAEYFELCGRTISLIARE